MDKKNCFYCKKEVLGKGFLKRGNHYCCGDCCGEHAKKGGRKDGVCEFC